MTISNKITEIDNQIEETSAVGAGTMSFAPSNQEDKLREVIRKSIKIYSRKKGKLSQEELQEQQLRNVIRGLINEQEETVAQNKTWMNVLSKLLNYMIPLMREQYVQLQTNMDEREGFKETVKTHFTQQFRQVDNTEEVEQERLEEEEAEKEANMSDVDKIKLRVKSSNPDFIDIDDGSNKGTPKQKKTEPDSKNAQSYQESGAQFAEEFIKSIGDRVIEDYSSKIPANEDRQSFKNTFFSNIESWYEIWDENKPVSQANDIGSEFDSQEDILDEPEADSGEEDVLSSLEEDLFNLLEADL
jgi:hypothetical protein